MSGGAVIWATILVLLPYVHASGIYEGALLPRLLVVQLGCLVLLVVTILARRKVDVPRRLLILTGLWTLAMLFSVLQAANQTESFVHLSHYLPLALLPVLAVSTLERRFLFLLARIVVIASIPVSLVGIAQYNGLNPFDLPSQAMPSAFSFHRNAAAGYLTAIIPIAAGCAAITIRHRVSWFYTLAGNLAICFIIFTRTRGAWLGIGVGLSIAILMFLMTPSTRQRNRIGRRGLLILASTVIFIAVAFATPDRMHTDGQPTFDDKKPTAVGALTSIVAAGGHRGRLGLWEKTGEMIVDQPVLGVGLGNWEYRYPEYAQGEHININAAPRRPHNDLLWILSETGIFGLCAYLALLIGSVIAGFDAIKHGSAEGRLLALSMMAVFASHLVDGLFNFPRERIEGASLFWLAVAGMWILRPTPARRVTLGTLPLAGAILVLIWATQLTVRRIGYDYHHLRVHVAEREGNWPEVLRQGPRAIRYGDFRANTWIAMGRAHYRIGDVDDAIRAHEMALTLHPNSLNAYNNLGIAYRKAGRPAEAIASLRRALALFPGFVEARNNLGNALRDVGEIDASIAVFENLLSQDVPAQIHVNLGRSYILKGDMQNAWRSFQNALKVDPDNRAAHDALRRLTPLPQS